jgi:predicted RNA-binding protein YlqC (UPF0109 family)
MGLFSRKSTVETSFSIKGYLEYIVTALVDNPDQVQVTEVEGGQAAVFELRVAQSDLGKVIGKSGATARSLRTLLVAASARQGKRAVLEIIE